MNDSRYSLVTTQERWIPPIRWRGNIYSAAKGMSIALKHVVYHRFLMPFVELCCYPIDILLKNALSLFVDHPEKTRIIIGTKRLSKYDLRMR